MWKRLSSSRLNKDLWDNCVQNDPAGLVTSLSWYLDVVAPQWEGWIKEENGQYTAVMPIAQRKIAGLPVITQPLLTQQFGLFTQNPFPVSDKQWQELFPLLFEFPEAVEKYCFKLQDYKNLKKVLPLHEKTNWILPLKSPYAILKTRYSLNRTRDLRRAEMAQVELQTGNNHWPPVYRLYRENILKRLKQNQQNTLIAIIPELVNAALDRGLGRVYLITLPSGEVVGGAFFIQYKNRLTYLLPATSETGKKVGASTYLIDQVCQQFAGSEFILDFEGSSIRGLARFYQSFGAQPEVYGLLENYKLPVYLKFLNFLKQFTGKT